MKLDNLIEDFESLLRYIAPGFTFIMIAGLIDPCLIKYFDEGWVWLITPFIGISWYAIHRALINLLDYPIYCLLNAKVQETIVANMEENSKVRRKYLYTRLANVHLAMMIGEQIIILNYVVGKSQCQIAILGIVLFGISGLSYFMTLKEIITYDKNEALTRHSSGTAKAAP